MTREERETIIIYDDLHKDVSISTCNPNMAVYLQKLCSEFPLHYKREKEYKDKDGETYCWTFVCHNKKLVKPKKPRIMSEKQKTNLFVKN